MAMPTRFVSWIAASDALIALIALALVLTLPLGFLLPFSDEWLRMNYLADHSPWEWTVMHTVSWVVRPTAEILMAWASLTTTRRALGDSADPALFLLRFRAGYAALALLLFALLYALARVLAGPRRALIGWGIAASCLWVCLWSSDGLGHAFYWADGYANVVLPFCTMLLGLALWSRGTPFAQASGALCLALAALGHEVMCIYSLGFVGLRLAFVSRLRGPRVVWGALLALALTALLYAQGFSAGPARRSQTYFERTGAHYDLEGAIHALGYISPLRSALACACTLSLLAIYRPWLERPLAAAARTARTHRVFWFMLVLGTFLASLVPLASVGLKKSNPGVDAYSVATELFVVLGAALAYPLLDRPLSALFDRYRRSLRSSAPVLLCAALLSPNYRLFKHAARDYGALHADAQTYMQALYDGRGQRVTVTRPCHPFLKHPTGMTMRNAKDYFGLERLREVQCRKP